MHPDGRRTFLLLVILPFLLAAAVLAGGGCSCLLTDAFVGDDAIYREGGDRDDFTEPDACRHVYFSHNHQFDDAVLARVLPNLKRRGVTVLALSGTRVTDASVGALRQLASLQVLSVDGTGMTPQGLTPLARLPRLREVHVGGERCDGDAVRKLKAELPSVNVSVKSAAR